MLAYIEQITGARSIEELWPLHTAKMAEYGFDRLIYGFTRFKTAHSLGDPQDMLMLTNHDQPYVDKFVGEGLYHHAPMVRWTLENEGACSWNWMLQLESEGAFSESERKVLLFNREMGVTAGYTVSFKSASVRAKGGIALTAQRGMSQDDVDAVWAEHGHEIEAMNNVAHLKIISLPYHAARGALTRRQREALEWVGDGKTMQDIAVIMDVSPATVEKHLRLARELLDVDTTAQAVLKASFQNQIFILEP